MSYIVPKKMPLRCFECEYISPSTMDGYSCKTAHKSLVSEHGINIRRPDWCPLIKIPPHGRLIDVDAHILKIRKQYCEDCSRRKGIKNGKMKFLYEIGGVVCRACEIEDMLNELDDAPTVIEMEGEE